MFCNEMSPVGDDNVNRNIERVGVNFVENLKIVGHTYFCGFCVCKKTVVISLATPHAVAVPVVCHSRNYHYLNIAYIGQVVAVGLLDVEGAEMKPSALVWQYFKIKPVDTRKEKMLAGMPFVDEFVSGEFIRQRVIEQNVVGHNEGHLLLKSCKCLAGSFLLFCFRQQALLSPDSAPYVFLFHYSPYLCGADDVVTGKFDSLRFSISTA